MSIPVKVYYEKECEGGTSSADIRRFRVAGDEAATFDAIHHKVAQLLPGLETGRFNLYWKDSDDDLVSCSTDDEMKEAFSSNKDSVLRLYVTVSNEPPTVGEANTTGETDTVQRGWRWRQGAAGWGMRGMGPRWWRAGSPCHPYGLPMMCPGFGPGWMMKKKCMKKMWKKQMKKHGGCCRRDSSPWKETTECSGSQMDTDPQEGAVGETTANVEDGDKMDGKCKKHRCPRRHHGRHRHHGHHHHGRCRKQGADDKKSGEECPKGQEEEESSSSSSSDDDSTEEMFSGPMNWWNMVPPAFGPGPWRGRRHCWRSRGPMSECGPWSGPGKFWGRKHCHWQSETCKGKGEKKAEDASKTQGDETAEKMEK